MNIKKLKALSRVTCEATVNLSNSYKAAKEFVDAYEHEEHEQRHESQAVPVKWSVEKDNAYHALTEAIFKRKPLSTIQKAAKTFVDICRREEIERKPKPDRAWSPEKHQAYNWLLDDFIMHKHYDEIIADARRLAAVCEREERKKPERDWSSGKQRAYGKLLDCAIGRMKPDEICDAAIELAQACKPNVKPETGDVYRDIFGNRYAVATEEFLDGEQPRVGLIRVGTKGEAIFPEFLTPTLEDFMNPTFKKV